MGGGRVFVKTVSASLFKEDPSNEPNFGQIHLTGQYLQADILKSQCQIGAKYQLYDLIHFENIEIS